MYIEFGYLIITFLAMYGLYSLFQFVVFKCPNVTHVKSGGQYEVLMEGTLESSLVTMTIYKSVDTGKIWIRPSNEFNDGRFD